MKRSRAVLACCVLLLSPQLSACLWGGEIDPLRLPLGGISPNQGRPLPERSFQLSAALGGFPDVAGTVPAIGTGEQISNPIPDPGATTWTWPGSLGLGVSAGLTPWMDVGFSMSRGLYSTVRVVQARQWSLSVSPAYYRDRLDSPGTTRGGNYFGVDGGPRGSAPAGPLIINQNLTALLAFRPGNREDFQLDLYAGSGINRYTVEIEDHWGKAHLTVPSLLAGITIDRVRVPSRRESLWGSRRFSIETAGAFLTQRDGRRDFVTNLRFQVALRTWPAW